jgi:hypothetical protein
MRCPSLLLNERKLAVVNMEEGVHPSKDTKEKEKVPASVHRCVQKNGVWIKAQTQQ